MRVSAVTAEYDTDAMAAAFSEMVTAVQDTGAIMPDLARLALSDADLREAFYFRHDTHWTPMGAARSAEALADLVAERLPGVFPKAGHAHAAVAKGGPEIEEEGSLAKMANKVCGAKVPPVTVPVPVFPDTGGSLLGDAPELPRVALAGSSFSDRYKRDHYRVADALAGALGAEVANYSVSGGGAIGALESLVLSGELERQRFDLVVWEIPYTQGFRSVGMLRQLLGALRLRGGRWTGGPAPSRCLRKDEDQRAGGPARPSGAQPAGQHSREGERRHPRTHPARSARSSSSANAGSRAICGPTRGSSACAIFPPVPSTP